MRGAPGPDRAPVLTIAEAIAGDKSLDALEHGAHARQVAAEAVRRAHDHGWVIVARDALDGGVVGYAGAPCASTAAAEYSVRAIAGPPGRVPRYVRLLRAWRGVSDPLALASQPALRGDVASVSTARRAMLSIGDVKLDRLRAARAPSRSRAPAPRTCRSPRSPPTWCGWKAGAPVAHDLSVWTQQPRFAGEYAVCEPEHLRDRLARRSSAAPNARGHHG
jgi:hypothetical protein